MPRTVHDTLTHAECGRRLNTPTSARKGYHKLAPNTLVSPEGPDYAVLFHSTPILRFRHDGGVTYDTRGHRDGRSATTKARLNAYGPCDVYQKLGVWFLDKGDGGPATEFRDGVTVYPHPDILPQYLTSDVLGLLDSVWQSNSFANCPILADALDEAGAPEKLSDCFRNENPRKPVLALYFAARKVRELVNHS